MDKTGYLMKISNYISNLVVELVNLFMTFKVRKVNSFFHYLI